MKKRRLICVRLTVREAAMLEALAEREGTTIAAIVRSRLSNDIHGSRDNQLQNGDDGDSIRAWTRRAISRND